jgi:hypothetical protein
VDIFHLVAKKTPTLWLVMLYLLRRSPDDLGPFKVSYKQVQAGTGLSRRTIQDAVSNLKNLGLLLVVQEHSREENAPAVVPLKS